MKISEEVISENITMMTVVGRLDAATSPEFETHLVAFFDQAERGMMLDFEEMDYISSAGLRALIVAAKKMKTTNGALCLFGLKEHVMEVFEIAGFSTIFEIVSTQSEARERVLKLLGR